MRRIASLFLGLGLIIGIAGCAEDTTVPDTTVTTPPAGDADADGEMNADDGDSADPTEQ